MVMQKHSTHKSELGFTLIELLIVIAIIGILAAIAIPQFNQYKIRGYDTSAKQGLRDVALLCNAYWIDNDCTEACSIPKIKDAAYGFNQNSDLDVTLPSASSQCSNFCASAKNNSSPNTYSIDSAALISSGGTCSGAGGAPATDPEAFANYKPSEKACGGLGIWTIVDSDGVIVPPDPTTFTNNNPFFGFSCSFDDDAITQYGHSVKKIENQEGGPYRLYSSGTIASNGHKVVFGCGGSYGDWRSCGLSEEATYNFTTGIWSNAQGEECEKGLSCR
jgi:type IV pilus assembly protein PilA